MECSKCDNKAKYSYVFGGETYHFCEFCENILSKNPTGLIQMFLQDNSSTFEELNMTPIERNMLAAKERRKRNEFAWN